MLSITSFCSHVKLSGGGFLQGGIRPLAQHHPQSARRCCLFFLGVRFSPRGPGRAGTMSIFEKAQQKRRLPFVSVSSEVKNIAPVISGTVLTLFWSIVTALFFEDFLYTYVSCVFVLWYQKWTSLSVQNSIFLELFVLTFPSRNISLRLALGSHSFGEWNLCPSSSNSNVSKRQVTFVTCKV